MCSHCKEAKHGNSVDKVLDNKQNIGETTDPTHQSMIWKYDTPSSGGWTTLHDLQKNAGVSSMGCLQFQQFSFT